MTVEIDTEDILEKHVELVAKEQAELLDGYVQLYIMKRPKWIPHVIYHFILGKVVVLAHFKRPNAKKN